MANVKFDLTSFNSFIKQEKIVLNDDDSALLNSIFKECDTVSEYGEQRPDGKLTGDEMRNFFSKLSGKLLELVNKFFIATNKEFAEEEAASKVQNKQDTRGIQLKPVLCERTVAEQEQFEKMLNNAKAILRKNKDKLGLTGQEMKYIESATTESVNYGAARYDDSTNPDVIRCNLNVPKGMPIPDEGSIIKVLLHEVNHAVRKSKHNSQAEERECETKAIQRSYILYQSGDINNDIAIYQSRKDGKIFNLSDFDNKNALDDFINLWLDECGYRGLPEE